MNGFMIAAPSSGAGKTTIMLGLLRALERMNIALTPVKSGPDYIDPAYHQAASDTESFNLDSWAMRPELISAVSSRITEGGKILVVEGQKGLFDGATATEGSSAELAQLLGLPVILVVDCEKLTHSVAAIVAGFSQFRRNVLIAGVVLNRVLSDRHETMLRKALEPSGIPVLGALPFDRRLTLPVISPGQLDAEAEIALEAFLNHAATVIETHMDLQMLRHIWQGTKRLPAMANVTRLPPLGSRIAIAKDEAFAFAFAHIFEAWRRRGAELYFFSPLLDDAPQPNVDAIYLPGGYPEIFAERLAASQRFREGMREAAGRGTTIYGEGGGYMVLGDGLTDALGGRHQMLGLLPVETSVNENVEYSGYRELEPLEGGPWTSTLRGHESHQGRVISEQSTQVLFKVSDESGKELGYAGHRMGSVSGSFVRVMDIAGERS